MGAKRSITDITQWKPQARRRLLLFSAIAVPLSLVLSLLTFYVSLVVVSRAPKPVDFYAAINEGAMASNFARKSLLLWMAGSSTSVKPLMARSSAAQSIDLSEVPFEVRWIDPAGVQRWKGDDAVQWRVTFDVTYVAPGSDTAQISRYAVTLLEHDDSYRLLLWPAIVNNDTTPFEVASKYTTPVDGRGQLHDQLQRFATAYLTSSGGATSLGQFVSANFRGSAIVDSPYTAVKIDQIRTASDDPPVSSAKPGTQLRVLLRVKASASTKTWSIMDLPLRVTMGENGVWLVDGNDSPVGWGQITVQ